MFDITKILLGIVNQEYYYLFAPISFLIMGLAIKYRLKEGEGYVGRLSMFSNSMALFSFYAFIPNTPFLMASIVNFAIILGIIGIISYISPNGHLTHKNYYRYTRWFDSVIVGLLILVYYWLPNLFQ